MFHCALRNTVEFGKENYLPAVQEFQQYQGERQVKVNGPEKPGPAGFLG